MSDKADRVTRVAADLMDSAATEGARRGRSAKQQLDHWARVGRAVSSQYIVARRRVEAALAGVDPLRSLTDEDGVVFKAEISATIQERLVSADYGAVLAARGITTVALDADGQIVRYAPDGSSIPLGRCA